MGVQLLKIGIKMKKGVILIIGGCFRSACNHPLLLGNLCFLIYLNRSFPVIFALLISASPVIICTAILLGTILSFGQPNLAEIETDEKTAYESVPAENEVSRDDSVVEPNETRDFGDKRDGPTQRPTDEPGSSKGDIVETSWECGDLNLEEKKLSKIESGNDEIWEEMVNEQKDDTSEWNGERLSGEHEVVEKRYLPIHKENENENEKSDDERWSFNSEAVDSPRSSWKHMKNEDDDRDDDMDEGGGSSNSESGGSRSSSPDASMADIMPMLDELHPLLDEDSSNPVLISHNVSDLVSERSSSSSLARMSSVDSVNEIEDEENEDDEGEKDEEQSKAAITWTEEDERNLMDLGSSEIERNQRLENLILRRRRKNVSMVPEINLIDLEGGLDFPPHVAAISTARQNPFDLPYENIPGSAPSVLLQRQNPFEIPYETDHERCHPAARESFFRRRESFGVGTTAFGGDATRMRPYFVPETGFSPFGRQSSGLSESKTSSAPDTESVGSSGSLEGQKLPEESNSPSELLPEATEEGPPEDHETASKKEMSEDEAINKPPQLISDMNNVSEHIGHGSQSSDDEDEGLSDSSQARKGNVNELNESCSEAVKISYGGDSSCSSISENEGPARVLPESGELGIEGMLLDENPHREPVYDSSPHSVKKNISSSSISSDVLVEPGVSLAPVVVKETVSIVERESGNREVEREIRADEHGGATSEVEILVNNNNSRGELKEEKQLMIGKGKKVQSPDSGGDYREANEKLMSTPSAEGSTSHFNDIAMHEPNFEHPAEVPVPNTPVEANEKVRTIQNLNIPEIYELDHEVSPSLGSPFSPDFISMPSSAGSHVDTRTIQEETDDDIKEIDGGLLSELDSVGDFTVSSGSGSNEFEKHIDFGEAAVHKMNSMDSRYYGENNDFDEMNSRDFTVGETSGEATFPKDNKHYRDINESMPKKDEFKESAEVSHSNEVETGEIENLDEVHRKLGGKEVDELVSNENKANAISSELNEDNPANISEEKEPTVGPIHDLSILDSRSMEEDTMDCDRKNGAGTETHKKPDSVDSRDAQETSDLHVEEIADPESSSLPSKESLDDNSKKVDSSVRKKSSVNEENSLAAKEKTYHEVKKSPEVLDSTTSIKGQGNKSESSSLRSSLSSSESDGE